MTRNAAPTSPTARSCWRAGLLVVGLLFHQLVTLLLAVLITVIVAIALAAVADRLERLGVPRPIGALVGAARRARACSLLICLLIPPFIDQTNEFVDDVPGIVDDLREQITRRDRGQDPGEVADRVQEFAEKLDRRPRAADRADHLDRAERGRRARRADPDPDHRLLHGGQPRAADRRDLRLFPPRAPRPRAPRAWSRLRDLLDRLDAGRGVDMLVPASCSTSGSRSSGSTSRSSSRC